MTAREDIRDKLVALFAEKSEEQVTQSRDWPPGHVMSDPEVPGFAAEYMRVSTQRKFVDALSTRGLTDAEERRVVIQQVHELARTDMDPESAEVLVRLVGLLLKPSWAPVERERFESGVSILLQFRGFFISYTRKNVVEVNEDYGYLISKVFGRKPPANEKTRHHYLARIVCKRLNALGLRGFFDEHDLKCGDDLKEKILENCDRVFAFIQLVELATYHPDDPAKNWCFREFSRFAEAEAGQPRVDGRKKFLLVDRTDPVKVAEDYRDWRDLASARTRHVDLSAIQREKRAVYEALDGIAKDIAAIEAKMIKAVLEAS